MQSTHASISHLPASVLVKQVAGGYAVTRCLHVVNGLGIADLLGETPGTVSVLARQAQVDEDALRRVFTMLAAHGIFAIAGNEVSHNPASRLLRSDHPDSLHDYVRLISLPIVWSAYGQFERVVQTGQPANESIHPNGFWGYLADHDTERAIFDRAMTAKAQRHINAIIARYDFSGCNSICDIGGGSGHLVRAVLRANPRTRGVLFDRPDVISEAIPESSNRLTVIGGDFFKDPLPICDLYLLMNILHDWSDTDALAILAAVRKAAAGASRLLVIEMLTPDEPGPHWSHFVDIQMLAMLGGRQRSGAQHGVLLTRAGLRLRRIIPIADELSIVEAEVP